MSGEKKPCMGCPTTVVIKGTTKYYSVLPALYLWYLVTRKEIKIQVLLLYTP